MNKIQTTTAATIEPPASRPRRLGRGLSALIGEPVRIDLQRTPGPVVHAPGVVESAGAPHAPDAHPGQSAGEGLSMLPLGDIRPSRFQPRRGFDESQLAELAASIRSAGVVQPVVVRRAHGGETGYELIAGERRWRAAKIAGLARLPAVVVAVTDEKAAEWALIENLQRADLRPMERADAVRALVERFGLSHAQAAERLGIDRSSIANMVRMTELEPPIRECLDAGTLLAGHAKALLAVAPGARRINLARRAAEQGWSVRRLEQAAGAPAGDGGEPANPNASGVKVPDLAVAKAAAVKELEKQLGEHLGTSVRIRAAASGKRGSLVIKFYDLDHFDGLMHKFGFALK